MQIIHSSVNRVFSGALLSIMVFYPWNAKSELPPGKKIDWKEPAPVLFSPQIVSTEDDEFGPTFTPDGTTIYFTKRNASTISSNVMVICYSTLKNGNWTTPQIAPFSGKYKDFNPSISPDGTTLFFISDRKSPTKTKNDTDIWMVKKSGSGWTDPVNLGAPVNSAGWELGCSVANDGTIYFSSTGKTGNLDLYRSRILNGKYQEPENLGDSVNSEFAETDPFIAPDQSYLLFSSQGRPDAICGKGASADYARSDLYISFRKDGKWTRAKNLGAVVNSPADESGPTVSKDGSTLYFTSERNFIELPMKVKLTYSYLEQHLHGTANGLGDIYEFPMTELLKNLQ